MSHRRVFQYIQRTDAILTWLNIFFLLTVAFLPVPIKVLGMYGDHQPAVIFYVGSLMITGLFLIVMCWYATHNHRLVDKQLDETLIERALIAPAIFLLAIAFSFASSYLAESILPLVEVAIGIHEYIYKRRTLTKQEALKEHYLLAARHIQTDRHRRCHNTVEQVIVGI